MIVKAAIKWLNEMSDAEIADNTDIIIAALTGNVYFPNANPTLAVLATGLAEFRTSINEAAKGGPQQTSAKNAKRAQLVSLLRHLASYLTTASGGNMTALLSSKFPTQKPTRQPIGDLNDPKAPDLTHGTLSGQIDAGTAPIYGAYTYNWRAALASAPDTYVQTLQTTAARVTFEGLTPGQLYSVDVNAVGAAGPSNWSDVSTLIAI
ncbi:MAG: fibronectin type III domain-containing protein [Verrucomicrobiota bacterium]|nr:fibronectin type III domain-containing protein [Verrucomicrobiota bacterium]